MSQNILELPAPKADPQFGHLLEYDRDPIGFWTLCAKEYGEIVPLNFGEMSVCFISNPQLIEKVLHEKNTFIKGEDYQILGDIFGKGLVTSDGDLWKHQRKLIQPLFLQERIANYAKIMVNYTEKMLNNWSDKEEIDVHAEMMRLTLNIAMKAIFDLDLTEADAKTIAEAFDLAMEWYENMREQGFIYDPNNPTEADLRYKKAIDRVDKAIYKIIQTRRKNKQNSGDLLSLLIDMKDENGKKMSDRQVRDEAATMILAGHETTANTLSWTWMLLAQNPQVRAKLQQELKEVLGNKKPTAADYNRLNYTKMVIKESMRLYPAVAELSRQTTREYNLGGYQIPANCTVMMCQWVNHRNPDYFPDPETFNPDRWANDLEKKLPKGVYFPFGDGQRICIGKGFALMEAVLLLATISQKFTLNLLPEHPILPQPSITLRPEKGIKVILNKR
ncbi:MAG: cytochrome P450 [Prochloraceae cyanobacterium]|nr:cytochrome P450 [Prochloraceae cyanobacterium]